MINFFRATPYNINSPAYYAAYDLKSAQHEAYSNFNSQFKIDFEEVSFDDIPVNAVIHTGTLDYAEAKEIQNGRQ